MLYMIESPFEMDFKMWLYSEYGAKNWYELQLILKHKYLSTFLDVNDVPLPLAIGTYAHQLRIDKLRKEIDAMQKYYNENQEVINKIKSQNDITP
jgi:hypothetical protein